MSDKGTQRRNESEINIKQSKIRVLSNEVTEISAHLSTLVSSIDFLHLRSVCDRENVCKLKHHETILEKKLFRLRKDVSKSSTPDPDKVILNYQPRTQALNCFYRDQWQLINA